MNDSLGLLDWFLASLELEATIFHRGQYCGSFRASTSGLGRATFHLVARGNCWFHRPGQASIPLHAGDAVFLLRDGAHALTSEGTAPFTPTTPVRFGEMTPMDSVEPGAVGLVCGFFDFKPGLSTLIADALPEHLLIRSGDPEMSAIRGVIELIVTESERSSSLSAVLVERLAGVLFVYLVRHLASRDGLSLGVLDTARHKELAVVLQHLVAEPSRAWSLGEMARLSGMSRATFFKRFREVAGCSPVGFLLALRVQLATQQLRRGDTIEKVAEQVGYHSTAAFARAFKRVTGTQPGAYRRAGQQDVATRKS